MKTNIVNSGCSQPFFIPYFYIQKYKTAKIFSIDNIEALAAGGGVVFPSDMVFTCYFADTIDYRILHSNYMVQARQKAKKGRIPMV